MCISLCNLSVSFITFASTTKFYFNIFRLQYLPYTLNALTQLHAMWLSDNQVIINSVILLLVMLFFYILVFNF